MGPFRIIIERTNCCKHEDGRVRSCAYHSKATNCCMYLLCAWERIAINKKVRIIVDDCRHRMTDMLLSNGVWPFIAMRYILRLRRSFIKITCVFRLRRALLLSSFWNIIIWLLFLCRSTIKSLTWTLPPTINNIWNRIFLTISSHCLRQPIIFLIETIHIQLWSLSIFILLNCVFLPGRRERCCVQNLRNLCKFLAWIENTLKLKSV